MHKLMFVCSRCGFTAFVERPVELELAGWRAESRDDGSSTVLCATCLNETGQDTRAVGASKSSPPARLRNSSD